MALARLRASGELIRPDQWEKVNQKQPWAPQTYIFRGKNVNNLAFRWPQPLSFMVLGVHGMHYCSFASTNLEKIISQIGNPQILFPIFSKRCRGCIYFEIKGKGIHFSLWSQRWKKPEKMEAVFSAKNLISHGNTLGIPKHSSEHQENSKGFKGFKWMRP